MITISNPTVTTVTESLKMSFSEFICQIGELTTQWSDNKGHDGRIKRELSTISYNGETYNVSQRFMNSLSSRFCFSHSIFNFFTPAEVFERLQMVEPQTQIRVVTQDKKCLAVTNPRKSYLCFDILSSLLLHKAHHIESMQYEEGMVKTIHRMDEGWDINGDKFTQMFAVNTPIDGYGLPHIVLALRREASGAYLIASGRVFKSEVQLGKDTDKPEIPLGRIIDTFNNEEGFQALRQRLESAQTSWASMNEVNTFYRAMRRACKKSTPWWHVNFENLSKLGGRVDQKYGIATMESVSVKKAKLLPMQCTISDLVNFGIEISSSDNVTLDSNAITNWVGDVLANEYDLEGTNSDNTRQVMGNYNEELTNTTSPFLM